MTQAASFGTIAPFTVRVLSTHKKPENEFLCVRNGSPPNLFRAGVDSAVAAKMALPAAKYRITNPDAGITRYAHTFIRSAIINRHPNKLPQSIKKRGLTSGSKSIGTPRQRNKLVFKDIG